MKISEIMKFSAEIQSEIDRILTPRMSPNLRTEILNDLRRDPPTGMTPEEMTALYSPDVEDEELDRAEKRARIDKMRADARHLDGEADRAEAEATAQRRGIRRIS